MNMKGKEITRKELAAHYGVATRTIHDWEKAGLSVSSRGGGGRSNTYNTLAVHDFLINRELAKRTISTDGKDYVVEDENARLRHHQANNEAIKEAQARGEMLSAEMVVEMCASLVSHSRARLLVIHNGIKNRYPETDNEIIDEIEHSIIQALNELGSDGIPANLNRIMEQYRFGVESAAENDGERMGG